MPKADGDPEKRDAEPPAEAGGGAGTSTSPDDVPPLHVLEAMQQQELKETEDLLAGFDRPARTPRRSPSGRDFVDFHMKKETPSSRDDARGLKRRTPNEVATVLVPRKRERPAWVPWAVVALVMCGLGGSVALVARWSRPGPSGPPTGPSAATTISAATAPKPQATISMREADIPPPPPPVATDEAPADVAAPTVVTAPPRREPPRPTSTAATTTSAPTTAGTGTSTSTAAPPRPPPRDDFIRDL